MGNWSLGYGGANKEEDIPQMGLPWTPAVESIYRYSYIGTGVGFYTLPPGCHHARSMDLPRPHSPDLNLT